MKTPFYFPYLIFLVVWLVVDNVNSLSVGQSTHLHRQQKRSILSLPRGVFKFTGQIIVPVLALINQTNTYLWFDLPSTWPLPNNNNLNTLYNNLGKLQEKGIEVDEEFVDEQRANHDRRTVYEYIESFFTK